MNSVTCKMDNQGRIMIPVEWRRELRLGPSSDVLLRKQGGAVVVQTRDEAIREVQEFAKRRFGPRVSLVRDLRKMRREEAGRERER